MKSIENSINVNGCSVCKIGEENYTTFRPAHRPNNVYYQYDYRHKDGELFSTVAPTLEQCRNKRDTWLNRKRLFPNTLKMIQEGKRLTKCDTVYFVQSTSMAYQISAVEPYNSLAISYDNFSRDDFVAEFNRKFGTSIK